MPFDDFLADNAFPLAVEPRSENTGQPCFYNMRTYWTVMEKVPPGFDWQHWSQLLPEEGMYGGPIVIMNVKNDPNVPLITEVPGGEKAAARDERAHFARVAESMGLVASARLFREERFFDDDDDEGTRRMCQGKGCKVSMDGTPMWMRKCKKCYYAGKSPSASTGPRVCKCGVSLEGLEHWKTACIECFKESKNRQRRQRRFMPY
tara:strand:+ start:6466 stop:7080 length:615 start_codon:yes stop_codon:yes gene_type:complete